MDKKILNKEFQRIEQASGSNDSQNYQDDPESTHGLKGKRGRPAKSKEEQKIEQHRNKQIEQRSMEQEGSNLHTTETTSLQHKPLKTIVDENNKRTGSNVITKIDNIKHI